MNDPITIPRTHIILDAAVLAVLSAGEEPKTPFAAKLRITGAALPDCSIEAAGGAKFPGIAPKLALYAVRSLIEQKCGHLSGEEGDPEGGSNGNPLNALIGSFHAHEFWLTADGFCEFCGGDLAGKAEQAAKAISSMIYSITGLNLTEGISFTDSFHDTCSFRKFIQAFSAEPPKFGLMFGDDIADSLIMRYQYGQTMTIPAGFLSIPSTATHEMLLALYLLEEGEGADRNICLIDIQRFMEDYCIWDIEEAKDRSLIDRMFGVLMTAGFLDDWSYDDGGSDYWKRAVISYHLNI